jgi:hypothetical protein
MDDLVGSKEKSVAELSQLAATLYSRVADNRIVNNTQQLSSRVGKLKRTTNVIFFLCAEQRLCDGHKLFILLLSTV